MSQFTQLFLPCPKFTDKDVPDQAGKVFIVTGGASGVGFEVSRILYEKNSTVYIAARTESRAKSAIGNIKKQCLESHGRLETLVLDLANPNTIKPAVESFLSKEQRLDILFNNAGVMGTSPEEKNMQVSKQLQFLNGNLPKYTTTNNFSRATSCRWQRMRWVLFC